MTERYPRYPDGYRYQPYYGGPSVGYGPAPENGLVWAILATVMRCLPLGIVAIVKSSQVTTWWYQGLHTEARKAVADTKKWAMWSAVSTGILLLLSLVFFVVIVHFGRDFSSLTPQNQEVP